MTRWIFRGPSPGKAGERTQVRSRQGLGDACAQASSVLRSWSGLRTAESCHGKASLEGRTIVPVWENPRRQVSSHRIKNEIQGWGFSSVAQCLLGKCKDVSLIPGTEKKKNIQKNGIQSIWRRSVSSFRAVPSFPTEFRSPPWAPLTSPSTGGSPDELQWQLAATRWRAEPAEQGRGAGLGKGVAAACPAQRPESAFWETRVTVRSCPLLAALLGTRPQRATPCSPPGPLVLAGAGLERLGAVVCAPRGGGVSGLFVVPARSWRTPSFRRSALARWGVRFLSNFKPQPWRVNELLRPLGHERKSCIWSGYCLPRALEGAGRREAGDSGHPCREVIRQKCSAEWRKERTLTPGHRAPPAVCTLTPPPCAAVADLGAPHRHQDVADVKSRSEHVIPKVKTEMATFKFMMVYTFDPSEACMDLKK
ncbi:PREDICTED: uncharacterized protein LOC102023921 [Chinchilla lanigera]|uniref:uncharacterized protein LOC102023921 n=1 Tax=Chinchilla lanigera TaxID=34839 RepID=UPI00038EEE2F|nr:PREDICTED: uncharacterized protein LOC102023921 [Chinchilla lanigera]